MGVDYAKMKNCLFYPFSLVDTLGTATNEKRPYATNNPSTANPSGINPYNYQADVPNSDGGTNPSMGLMVSYNQFNWTGGYTGRKGATRPSSSRRTVSATRGSMVRSVPLAAAPASSSGLAFATAARRRTR